jgi:hypothetical protein
VVGLLSGDDGGVGGEHEMDSGVGDEVGLELGDVDVEGSVESEGGGQTGDNLADESVEVGVGGPLDVELSSADVVDGFVVEHDGDIGVLQEGVGGQDGVVGFNNGGGDLGTGVDGETKFGFLSVVDGKSLKEKGSESGSGSSSDGLEDQESLESGTVVSELSDSVEAEIDAFSSNGVVTSGEIVSGVLLSGDELLGVEQLSVGSGSDLVDDGGLKIDHDTSGDVLAGSGLGEESVEGIITSSDSLIRGHLSIRLDTVL